MASAITALVGGVAGDYVIDESNGQWNVYGWNSTAFRLISQTSNNHFGFGNVDVMGTQALTAGTATVTFQKAYSVAPICFATDTTAANAVKTALTTTTVVLTGTTTDVIAYLCFANPNKPWNS